MNGCLHRSSASKTLVLILVCIISAADFTHDTCDPSRCAAGDVWLAESFRCVRHGIADGGTIHGTEK